MFLAKRLLGSSGGFAKEPTPSSMPVVMDPPLTTQEVASQAAAALPGVRVLRTWPSFAHVRRFGMLVLVQRPAHGKPQEIRVGRSRPLAGKQGQRHAQRLQ
jgi:hypothetical protein